MLHVFINISHLDTYSTRAISKFDKDPTPGEDYPLWCMTLTKGRPADIIHYAWSKDGKDLNELDKHVVKEDSVIIKVDGVYKITHVLMILSLFYVVSFH